MNGKPHYRLVGERWVRTFASEKPRLKLQANGQLQLVRAGHSNWSVVQADKFVRDHYGSRAAFARQWNLRYDHVGAALAFCVIKGKLRDPGGLLPGQTPAVRLVLGLASCPSSASCNLSLAQCRRKRAES